MLSNKSNKELVEAGHQFAKALDADIPLTEIAKLVSALSTRLDCAIVRGNELQQKLDSMAAENAALKKALNPAEIPEEAITAFEDTVEFDHDFKEGNSWTWVDNENEVIRAVLAAMSLPETPATDAYLNSVRAEGIHFAANRILAAWECGFINDTPEQAHDISGAVLSALEFLPNASPEEFKRDYADEVRASIEARLRSGTHDTADKAGAK
ncbi:hypothetical protein [Pantoea allii]|uniref:hypothetical protein n=1 Tax=Pantoea allii TaxID=574096 RepID=UPI000BB4241E|nr:hypothetical protein [Pantoea allii]MBW1251985.1 hypothetical protein [Pantoea allii]MBW1260582.1 hypothetical protein [Pantoea allii]MBW1283179.1 hypothetical protein [Pantoea allii]PBJ98692.1 hypothetical protein CMR03_18490 [Pantoea allii]